MENQLEVWSMILGAGLMVKFVLLLLLLGSVASWAIIFYKIRLYKKIERETSGFEELFWKTQSLSTISGACAKFKNTPLARQFEKVYAELVKIKKHPDPSGNAAVHVDDIRRFQRILSKTCKMEKNRMEYAVGFLATAGNSAPFIGLFGTVWGIMASFRAIGEMGAANLAVVAPGISEALIATAIGLFVAIPAVIGYNHLITKSDRISVEMEIFSSDLINIIEKMISRQDRGES